MYPYVTVLYIAGSDDCSPGLPDSLGFDRVCTSFGASRNVYSVWLVNAIDSCYFRNLITTKCFRRGTNYVKSLHSTGSNPPLFHDVRNVGNGASGLSSGKTFY